MMLLLQSICHGHSGTRGRSPFKREVIIQARVLFTCQICLIFRQETRCHKCQRDPTNKCEFCDRWAWFATTISWALWFFILIVFRLICWAHRRFCYLAGRDKRVTSMIKMYLFLKQCSSPSNSILNTAASTRRFSALIVKQSELYMSPFSVSKKHS